MSTSVAGRRNEPTFEGQRPRDETGVELYYKATITDWSELTADVKVVEPAIRRNATTAVVAGLRANIEF